MQKIDINKKYRTRAGLSESGKPTVWRYGATSWSQCAFCEPKSEWQHARKPEVGE